MKTGAHTQVPVPMTTVAGDSIKAWLDSELMFDEVLK